MKPWAFAAVAMLTGCAGAAPSRSPAKPVTPTPDRERAACEAGDDLLHATGQLDDTPIRRTRAAPTPLRTPALLADPLPSPGEAHPLPELSDEPITLERLGPIAKITLQGYRNTPTDLIRNVISLHEGDQPKAEAIRRDVKELYATGLFDNIQVNFTGDADHAELTYLVEERPALGEVYFVGATTIHPATLREVAALGDLPSHARIAAAAEKIKERYAEEGRSYAEVSPRLRVQKGKVDVCFRIAEGIAVRIERWAFQGNQAIRDADLRAVMATDDGKVNTEGGVYREDAVEIDQMRQLALYYDRGYLTASIDRPTVVTSDDKARLTVTVAVHEGPMFRLGSINVDGDLVADRSRYIALFQSKAGDPFNRSQVMADIERIRTLHKDAGQPFIEVLPKTQLDPAHGTVDLSFEIARQKVIK